MKFLQIEVNKQNYLLDTDIVLELIHYEEPTRMSTQNEYIEGIINHKDKVVPIITIRKLLKFISFKDEQVSFIGKVEEQHRTWVEEFEASLYSGDKFTKTFDPHQCELGEWIDKNIACLRCNNHGFVDMLEKELVNVHEALHNNGAKFFYEKDADKDEQMQVIKKNADQTIAGLHKIEENIYKLTSAFEQIVLVQIDGVKIGLVVDRIDKTHDLDEKEFFRSRKNLSSESRYIQFVNYYDIEGTLMFSINFTQEFKELLGSTVEKDTTA